VRFARAAARQHTCLVARVGDGNDESVQSLVMDLAGNVFVRVEFDSTADFGTREAIRHGPMVMNDGGAVH
jgi:hypothetical protein